ncbi:MAG: Na/Pi symporter [Thermodesulfobacteriota bacterium]|nr:Na/Pi symporter [Thermodesulfobacteriota bacterium]
MSEILGNLIGGMGVFLVGMHMITNGLKQMTGHRFRMLLSSWTDRGSKAGLIGLFLGIVTQSGSGISFVVASVVAGGLITVRQSLPVIFWANAGFGVLVLLAFMDIKVLVLFLLGVAGISIAFDKPSRYRQLADTLFGVGLLFYGLHMIRTGAMPLAEEEWFKSLLLQGRESFVLAFIVGAVLTAISQSSSAVAILAITMTQSGLFSFEQTIMIIYGTALGSSAITWFLSTSLKGTPRQLVMAQVFFNVVALVILVPLFYLEFYGHVPLVKALVVKAASRLEQQMAYVYVLLNLCGTLTLSFMTSPYAWFLARLWPPTQQEDWSQLEYLHDHALKDPETALALIEKEQARLLERLPLYMEELRMSDTDENKPNRDVVHSAFQTVSREIDGFVSDLLNQTLSADTSERVLNVQNRQGMIVALEKGLYEMVLAMETWSPSAASRRFKHVFVEGLDTILITAAEASASLDQTDIEMLTAITHDRSEMMHNMRQTYLASEKNLTPDERMIFLRVTGLYERLVWTINRIAVLYKNRGR